VAHAHADYSQVAVQAISSQDENGQDFSEDGYVIPVIVPASEVAELLLNYDPTSSTSPTVAYSRPLSRVILDALKRYVEENP